METLLMILISFFGYIVMYKTYGQFLGKKIFQLNAATPTPAHAHQDGIDFVPTKKEVIFGHHFTSIAGTGPIVGPAIAVIWGWLPALLWVFLGSVFMGAVHDLGSLVISLRNEGKSISDYAGKYINPRIKALFFFIVFLELWIVIAIFGLVIAIIFAMYPASVLPIWLEIPIAILFGYSIYKKNGNVTVLSIVAVIIMYATVYLGYLIPIKLPTLGGFPVTGLWTIILLIYAYWASVLPVTTLLQPRDFINSHQLFVAMGLLLVGILATSFTIGLPIVAPMVQLSPKDSPSVWPILFITIACGAISGFHSLVSSGTTSKQIKSEPDALFVGYGSMLMEGALAVIVIAAVVSGIGMGYNGLSGSAAWQAHYASWNAADGLGSKISAFVVGSANILTTIGISLEIGIIVMGVFVASFAGTTLDTATRIQRYVVTEFFGESLKITIFKNRYFSTFFAVLTGGALAFTSGADGKGALALWPLFGAINQTLAALALMVVTLYLRSLGGYKWLIAGLPALFMTTMTIWATIENQIDFINKKDIVLVFVNLSIIIAVIWITIEYAVKLSKSSQK